MEDGIYKLIVTMPQDKQGPLPFYAYGTEDPNGNNLGNFTKIIFTIDPDDSILAQLTMHTRTIDEDGKLLPEKIITARAEIEVRHPKENP
jgi:hypothetical protein